MWADNVNGLYEALAGLFILNNCRMVVKDKKVKGVSIVSVVFFATWGGWNLYYYPSLGQWASFWGGLAVFTANLIWIGLMLKYRKNV